jgi:hypothetical protein
MRIHIEKNVTEEDGLSQITRLVGPKTSLIAGKKIK